jgi:hypothetical protein
MVGSNGGYVESWFFHFAYPKHIQLLIKTILQGKFQFEMKKIILSINLNDYLTISI